MTHTLLTVYLTGYAVAAVRIFGSRVPHWRTSAIIVAAVWPLSLVFDFLPESARLRLAARLHRAARRKLGGR